MSYRELSQFFQARHIMAPVVSEGCVAVGAPMREVREKLTRANFDHGVVLDQNGAVLGFVTRAELPDTEEPFSVLPFVRQLMLDYVIADNTPLEEVIGYVARSPFQLVVRGKEVVGLLTPWDLNSHPVYSYFYLLLSQLEQLLVQVIKHQYPNEGWTTLLSAGGHPSAEHLEDARKRWQKARVANQELPLLHYLYFSDYVEIVGRCSCLFSALVVGLQEKWKEFIQRAVELRNDVAHPTKDLVGEHRSARDLLEIARDSRTLMEKAEAFLSQAKEKETAA